MTDEQPGRAAAAAATGLPNLVIPGVTKAGTTSLFAYLAQHPDICAGTRKGTNYFSPLRYEGGTVGPLEEYQRFFAHCGDEPYRLEATLSYFYGGRRMVDAIRDVLGAPRVVISLRDPVLRLWSSYKMKTGRRRLLGGETFEGFVDRCEELSRSGEDILEENNRFRTLRTGLYAEYVAQWLDAFGDDCRVVFFEQLVAEPAGVVGDLCQWLGIDPAVASTFDYSPRNRSVVHRNPALQRVATTLNRRTWSLLNRRPGVRRVLRDAYLAVNSSEPRETLRPETRDRLRAYYRASDELLAADLTRRGYRDLPAWLGGPPPAPAGGGTGPA